MVIRFIKRVLAIFILFGFASCGGGKMAAENKALMTRVTELEHRIYELTESPDHIGESVLKDAEMLMNIPYKENLDLASDMLTTFLKTYPNNIHGYKMELKLQQINDMYDKTEGLVSGIYVPDSFKKDKNKVDDSTPKIQVSVQIVETSLGFVNVEMKVQNISDQALANIWIKATMVNSQGESYGITQDFFFNRLSPYDYKTEVLSWEYVKADHIAGITLSQLRYSLNRQTRLLKKEECKIGQGNVKIFLEF
ncbi:hypothetical protein [Lentimicrobium sp. S6]|uniref:hypothetical protein n=1 Tax=Lentimicrobium sp. S6 TaxID=2735872 RepID=UPI001C12EDC9|nr:hypothetical protein [Lentimicrobium sp. S6]